jgi:hypothetical protein
MVAGKAAPLPHLPDLIGRVAVLGGQTRSRTELCTALALSQTGQHGVVVCLDAHRRRQLEMPFRLLLRKRAAYILLPADGTVSNAIAQRVLTTLQKGLQVGLQQGPQRGLSDKQIPPPLLLLDGALETADWEQTLTFFLRTGVTIVEFLTSPAALVFGRYETTLLFQSGAESAEAISQAVGRKVEPAGLMELKKGEGYLIHLAQVYRVQLPSASEEV